MDQSVKQMSSQYQSTLNEISTLREGLLRDNEELITEIALLRGQVQDQAVAQEAVRRNISSLTQQVRETEEAIAAIDRHRLQLTQKLAQLQDLIQTSSSASP